LFDLRRLRSQFFGFFPSDSSFQKIPLLGALFFQFSTCGTAGRAKRSSICGDNIRPEAARLSQVDFCPTCSAASRGKKMKNMENLSGLVVNMWHAVPPRAQVEDCVHAKT